MKKEKIVNMNQPIGSTIDFEIKPTNDLIGKVRQEHKLIITPKQLQQIKNTISILSEIVKKQNEGRVRKEKRRMGICPNR